MRSQSTPRCSVDGCERARWARGLCRLHEQQERRQNESRSCSVDGCERIVSARGLCSPHYDVDRRRSVTSLCAAPGCERVRDRAGLCVMHYTRKWRHGDFADRTRSASDRLWQSVIKSENGDGCWLWQGATGRGGYGVLGIDGKQVIASRFALEQAMGAPLPKGYMALHTCDTPACVRNDEEGTYVLNGRSFLRFGHLWLGTNADNTEDRQTKGRSASGERSGLRQHPERAARGEAGGTAKLGAEQVRTIRDRYVAGTSMPALAGEFGITRQNVRCIVRRTTWRHIA